MKTDFIEVVALALRSRSDGTYLLAQRKAGDSGAGLWEFPGGKIESTETQAAALMREIEEELGVLLTRDSLSHLASNEHNYGERKIRLHLWLCEVAQKPQITLIDHQAIVWVRPSEMGKLTLSEADKPFISLLK